MFLNKITSQLVLDAPTPWGLFFQDSASPQMEGIEELHNNIMFYLVLVLFSVLWVFLNIEYKYVNLMVK